MFRIISNIYFESEGNFLPESVVAKLQQKGYEIKRLPLLEVPQEVLEKDKNLKNQPLYEAINKTHKIILGDRMLGIVIDNAKKIDNGEICKFIEFIEPNFQITRLGLRVINFKSPIKKENIKILVAEKSQKFDNCFLRFNKKYKNYESYVTFDNNKDDKEVIDIIVFMEHNMQREKIAKNIESLVEKVKGIYDEYGV